MERDSRNVRPHEERQSDMLQTSDGQTNPMPYEKKDALSSNEGNGLKAVSEAPPVKERTIYVVKSPVDARKRKKAWYNQGWIWLIVSIAALAVIWFALSRLTEQTAQINDSLREQTEVLRTQNNILKGIVDGIGNMNRTISHEFDRLITVIREALKHFGIS